MLGQSSELVSVIVVTCGANDYLYDCLESIKQQTCFPNEVMVIDNSLDRELNQKVSWLCPDFKIYRSANNLSYCDSLNQGIALSRGGYILCLNDDVILDKDFIQNALRGFYIAPDIGMVSGKILRMEAKILDSTGLFLTLWRTVKERGYSCVDRGQFEKAGYVFGVTGAAAFYRREMLEVVKEGDKGYFDPDFHFFYEDLDISWRAQTAGWKGYYIPQALARHLRGGSVRRGRGIGKPYARRYLDDGLHLDLVKNRYLVLIKNESALGLLLHLPFLLLYEFAAWGYTLVFKPRLVKDFFSSLGYLKSAWNKRRSRAFLRRKNVILKVGKKAKNA